MNNIVCKLVFMYLDENYLMLTKVVFMIGKNV